MFDGEKSVPRRISWAVWNLGYEATRAAGSIPKKSAQLVADQTLGRVLGFRRGPRERRPSVEHGIVMIADGWLETTAAVALEGKHDDEAREGLVAGALLLIHCLGVDPEQATLRGHQLPVERVDLAVKQAHVYLGENL